MRNHFLHHYSWALAKDKLRHLDLVPFYSIHLYLTSKDNEINATGNLVGNIVGFIPLGILLPMLFKKLRAAKATILAVFFFSLGFEVTQLLILLGYFDVDDLILNTLGGAIGYLLFALLRKRVAIR
jgi:glycopeptide antibiotics resistance protein